MTHPCPEENILAFHQCCSLDVKHLLKTHVEPKGIIVIHSWGHWEMARPGGLSHHPWIHIFVDSWGVSTLWTKVTDDMPLCYGSFNPLSFSFSVSWFSWGKQLSTVIFHLVSALSDYRLKLMNPWAQLNPPLYVVYQFLLPKATEEGKVPLSPQFKG